MKRRSKPLPKPSWVKNRTVKLDEEERKPLGTGAFQNVPDYKGKSKK